MKTIIKNNLLLILLLTITTACGTKTHSEIAKKKETLKVYKTQLKDDLLTNSERQDLEILIENVIEDISELENVIERNELEEENLINSVPKSNDLKPEIDLDTNVQQYKDNIERDLLFIEENRDNDAQLDVSESKEPKGIIKETLNTNTVPPTEEYPMLDLESLIDSSTNYFNDSANKYIDSMLENINK